MDNMSKNLGSLIAHFNAMKDQGLMETEQVQSMERGIRKLRRAVRANNRKQIEAAVNEIAKAVLKITEVDAAEMG